ncbi:MAG: SLC13 family permease [Maritimibacter sp.]
MEFFDFSQSAEAVIALIVVGAMFLLFLREAFPAEVVAIGGVSMLLVLGVLPYDDALAVLSNPAPWTIAALFIVMGALTRTGALDRIIKTAEQQAGSRPTLALGVMLAVVLVASGFVNNTPVVVMMLPIFTQMAGRMGNKKVTTKNVIIAKIDPENNILCLMGSVPGKRNGFVKITGKI